MWRVPTTWEEVLERSGVGLIVLFCLILFRDILSFLSFSPPSPPLLLVFRRGSIGFEEFLRFYRILNSSW